MASTLAPACTPIRLPETGTHLSLTCACLPPRLQINARVAEEMQRQAEQAQRQRQKEQFQSAVDGLFGGFGRGRGQQQAGGGGGGRRTEGGAGKTIDVEYELLDPEGK